MMKFIRKLLKLDRGQQAEKLHKANIKEVNKTTKSINKLNKMLMQESVSYRLYVASGHKKV